MLKNKSCLSYLMLKTMDKVFRQLYKKQKRVHVNYSTRYRRALQMACIKTNINNKCSNTVTLDYPTYQQFGNNGIYASIFCTDVEAVYEEFRHKQAV